MNAGQKGTPLRSALTTDSKNQKRPSENAGSVKHAAAKSVTVKLEAANGVKHDAAKSFKQDAANGVKHVKDNETNLEREEEEANALLTTEIASHDHQHVRGEFLRI